MVTFRRRGEKLLQWKVALSCYREDQQKSARQKLEQVGVVTYGGTTVEKLWCKMNSCLVAN